MKLTHITARNLKGRALTEIDLKPVTCITGDNFAGKSAVLDAIQLLLVGHVPRLGKTNQATFTLCSGRELVVEGLFDDGSKMWRRWFLKGDSVKGEDFIPPAFENKGPLMAAMLDANSYFGLSDRERVDFVFKNVPGTVAKLTVGTMMREVDADLRMVGSDEEDEDKRREMTLDPKRIDAYVAAVERAVRDPENKETLQPGFLDRPELFVDFAVEHTEKMGKKAKEHAAMMEKSVNGLSAMRLADAPARDVTALELQKTTLEDEIRRLQDDRARASAAMDATRANSRRKDQLAAELRAKDSVANLKAETERRLAAAKEELAGTPAASETIQLYQEKITLHSDVQRHARDLGEAEAALARLQREKGDVDSKDRCPYCGAAGDGWKALKQAELDSAVSGLGAKIAAIKEAHLLATKNHEGAEARHVRSAQVDKRADELRAAVRVHEQSIKDHDLKLALLASKEEELGRIGAADDPGAASAHDIANTLITVKTAEAQKLTGEIRALASRQGELKRLAQMEMERDEAKADEKVCKEAAKRLREVKAGMVEKTFEPLLESANTIFGEVMASPLSFRDGIVGTWRGGVWVSHKTLSGAEQSLSYAAIQAALAAKAPSRIMLLDEMGNLTDKRREAVWARAAEAIREGRIDQVVGVYPSDNPEKVSLPHVPGVEFAVIEVKAEGA